MTNHYFRIALAMILVLALSILPLPVFLNDIRPPWILLLILYLQCYLERSFHLFYIIFMGLALDALLMTTLGQHALILTLVAWMAHRNVRYFRLYSIGQQMAWIGFFCFSYQGISMVIDVFLGNATAFSFWPITGGTITGLLFWPWVRLIADDALNKKSIQ